MFQFQKLFKSAIIFRYFIFYIFKNFVANSSKSFDTNLRISIIFPKQKAHPEDTLLTKFCLKIKHYYGQTAFWKVLVFEPRTH